MHWNCCTASRLRVNRCWKGCVKDSFCYAVIRSMCSKATEYATGGRKGARIAA